MSFLKKILKKIRVFFRSFDIFGDSFTFHYKEEDSQSSPLGGFIFIIFAGITALYLITNFIPFLNEENFTLQYYTMNLEDTEQIKLSEEPVAFGFGLTVNNTNSNLSDLFKFRVEFRKSNVQRKTINYSNCDLSDFHNLHDKYLNKVNIEDYYCISHEDLSNNSPEGIYTGINFSYYMISLESKYLNNETHNQLINDYLVESDCKLQFYYSDITIDVDDYRNPISSVLNSMFIQLDPTIIQKRNILFMNYHLSDEDSFLHVIPGEEKSSTKTGLSRIEDYSVYKGLNRVDKKTDDYNIYAKIYIRADNRKVEIYRTYQDFMDFYDETTAIFWTLYYFAILIIPSYDRKKSIHSISKKLFFFEGTKYINNEKMKKLKNILNSNEISNKSIEINTKEDEINENIIYTKNPKTNETINKKSNKQLKNNINNEIKKDDIIIDYSNYNLFEIIASLDIFCKTEKFKNKLNLIEQAENIIDEKLDIIYYVRNMIKFELINKIYLEDGEIINFLSRPIIYYSSSDKKSENNLEDNSIKISINSFNQNENNESNENNEQKKDKDNSKKSLSELYKSAYSLKANNILSENIKELVQNHQKTQSEDKIVDLLQKHLEFIE